MRAILFSLFFPHHYARDISHTLGKNCASETRELAETARKSFARGSETDRILLATTEPRWRFRPCVF